MPRHLTHDLSCNQGMQDVDHGLLCRPDFHALFAIKDLKLGIGFQHIPLWSVDSGIFL